MDKLLFSEVVKNCAVTSQEDAEKVIKLRSQYPFSQVLQILSAKISKDHQLSSSQELLQHAAVYSSDRSILKDIMTREIPSASPDGVDVTTPTPETDHHVTKDGVQTLTFSTERLSEDEKKAAIDIPNFDLADTLMRDLEKLYELRHNFEMLFSDEKTVSLPDAPPVVASDVPENENVTNSKSKREKIIEIARRQQSESGSVVSNQPVIPAKKRNIPPDNFIEEIKTSKDELEPESDRQKEQLQIIEHFIKIQPTISNARDRAILLPSDLNSIKPGEFGENIISETLVEILIKQGKKERAIEVLKKLIWKYPQKKAYFASQIEDLKK